MCDESPYNYRSFPVETDVDDFRRFPDIIKTGTTAPDGELTDLESGETVRLKEFTRSGVTILEFGSLT